jgi:hypothetical protein
MTTLTAVYVWSENARFNVPAQVVGEMARAIAQREGVCTADRIVEEARPADAPLHPAFPWDDFEAAEAHRRDIARHMLRSVRIKVEERVESAPVFVRVQGASESGVWSGYKMLPDLTVEERSQVEEDTLAQLNGLRRRHSSLQRFRKVWDAIEEL